MRLLDKGSQRLRFPIATARDKDINHVGHGRWLDERGYRGGRRGGRDEEANADARVPTRKALLIPPVTVTAQKLCIIPSPPIPALQHPTLLTACSPPLGPACTRSKFARKEKLWKNDTRTISAMSSATATHTPTQNATSEQKPTPGASAAQNENMPPTPEVRLNGRRASSLHGVPSTSAGGDDGWGSHFWVTLIDPQVCIDLCAVLVLCLQDSLYPCDNLWCLGAFTTQCSGVGAPLRAGAAFRNVQRIQSDTYTLQWRRQRLFSSIWACSGCIRRLERRLYALYDEQSRPLLCCIVGRYKKLMPIRAFSDTGFILRLSRYRGGKLGPSNWKLLVRTLSPLPTCLN